MAWGWLSTLNDSDEDLASLSVRPQVPQETSSHLPYSQGFLGGGDGWVALGPWRYHPIRRRNKVTHVSSAMTTGTLVSGQGYEVSTNDDGFWEPENGSHRNADIFIECLTVVETRAEC